ncbi:MAG: hypothetical protein QF464_18435, partial [Myxococcota bacterium]|nr:hypothetical protein [Myxococcota bacterium]
DLGDLQRPIMDTFAEWEAYRAAGGDRTCVDCHMPALSDRPAARGGVPRPAHDHRMLGPFDLEFVRQGVGIEAVSLETTPPSATLTLVNQSGHRLPTAEPHRALVVSLELRDDDGRVLTRDIRRVERVLDLTTLTERPGEDTSLGPRERRLLSLTVAAPPDDKARSARLVVHFVLWDHEDAVARAAGLTRDDLVHTLYERVLPLSTTGGR